MADLYNPPEIRVLSLNVWGLPDRITNIAYKRHMKTHNYKPTSRTDRMKQIGSRLQDFDVVCFQEVWLPSGICAAD
jgi:hypothetical protein